MSITQIRPTDEKRTAPVPTGHPWRRLTLLGVLLAVSIGYNIYVFLTAPGPNTPQIPFFITTWLCAFLPYLAACGVVLVMKPQTGRLRWVELGMLLVGALALRAIVLPVPPNLSHDSWRYLWDARVTLHGFSPYVTGPANSLYLPLRDFLYNDIRFRDVPTIYPPGAQGIFLLSYLIAPSNLVVLKGIFIGFEMVTCGALAFLLWRKGLDMSRCIIYAWCPLPIIEFAIQGHLDATTVTFTVLAMVCAGSQWRGSRVVTGFLIALAALTKVYPILFLLVVVRRRDWALLVTCFATIIIAYVPYLILGRGQVFGFFSTYASQDYGFMQWVIIKIGGIFSLNHAILSIIIYAFDVVLVGSMSIAILRWRWQERISMEASVILLIGAIFAVSSNLLPWYTVAFLPWIALQIGPLWTKQGGFNEANLAVIATWYYVCSNVISYYMSQNLYFSVVNGVTLFVLAFALGMRIRKNRLARRNEPRDHKRWPVIGAVRFLFGKYGKGKA
jgi:hypothetical protein